MAVDMSDTSANLRKRAGLRCSIKRLGKAREGAAAMEFAIVAPVFLALMFTMFEVGWFYFVNSALDGASLEIARAVRTGQVQKAAFDKEEFFDTEVCGRLGFLVDCDARITAEVQTFDSFAALAADTAPFVCTDDEADVVQALEFEPGLDNSIVRLRLCMIYDTLNPTIGLSLAKNDLGQRRLYSTYILRVEPYSKNKKT